MFISAPVAQHSTNTIVLSTPMIISSNTQNAPNHAQQYLLILDPHPISCNPITANSSVSQLQPTARSNLQVQKAQNRRDNAFYSGTNENNSNINSSSLSSSFGSKLSNTANINNSMNDIINNSIRGNEIKYNISSNKVSASSETCTSNNRHVTHVRDDTHSQQTHQHKIVPEYAKNKIDTTHNETTTGFTSKSKPFKCHICHKYFKRQSNLRIHAVCICSVYPTDFVYGICNNRLLSLF